MAQVTGWAAAARRKGPSRKVLIGGLLAVVAIVALILSGMRGATVYSLTIRELRAKGAAVEGQGVRVAGTLDGGSVAWDPQALTLEFRLVDGGEALPVTYHGVRPDMFNDGAEVIVEGKLSPEGVFTATKLLLKCPSKYESGTAVYEATE